MIDRMKLTELPMLSELSFEMPIDEVEGASTPQILISTDEVQQVINNIDEKFNPVSQFTNPDLSTIEPISELSNLLNVRLEFLLSAYLKAAALRYLFQFESLIPLIKDGNSIQADEKLNYNNLPKEYQSAVFAHLTGKCGIAASSENEFRWMLKDEERRDVIQKLFENNDTDYLNQLINQAKTDALKENIKVEEQDNTSENKTANYGLEELFWVYLQGKTFPLEQQNRRKLILIQRVIQWLPSNLNVPSKELVATHLARETLLQPFRHLTGKWENGQFVSYFIGRETELNLLYEYLAVQPPKSLFDYLKRVVSQISNSASQFVSGKSGHHLPLLIYGPGGIGKSTLLAKFLLEHLTGNTAEKRFPYAYLDFDLSILDSQEPLTLIAEMARQFAVQYSSSSSQWEKLRSECLDLCRSKKANELSNELSAERKSLMKNLKFLLENSEAEGVKVLDQFNRNLPLLLVIDTFEEVQYRTRDGVKDIFRFINELQERIPATKVILMGRASLTDVSREFHDLESFAPIEGDHFESRKKTDLSVIEVKLGDLNINDARNYLMQHGINDPSFLDELMAVIGGNPLSLRLITQLVEKDKLDISSLRSEINWQPSLKERLFGQGIPPKEILQGVLFRRILGHIHNKEIEALAHPGLVLRRISPEVISKVLAVPCGLGNITTTKATALFDGLAREVSLVRTEIDENGELILFHRPELRKIMLKLIESDETKQTEIRKVHENAIQYYSKRDGKTARTEEFYHRLMIDQLPTVGLLDEIPTEEAIAAGFVPSPAENDLRQVWRNLANVSNELPFSALTYLDGRLNLELAADKDWENAQQSDWELMVLNRVSRRMRERGSLESAYETLNREKNRFLPPKYIISAWSPLNLIEIALLEQLGRYHEALEIVQRSVEYIRNAPFEEISVTDRQKRQLQYNFWGMRLTAYLKDNNSIHNYLDYISAVSNNGFPHIETGLQTRYKRQIIRFISDCFSINQDLEEQIIKTLDSILLNIGLENLENCPILVSYVFAMRQKISTHFPFEILLKNSKSTRAVSIFIGVVKSSTEHAPYPALAQWVQKAVAEGIDATLFTRFLGLKSFPTDLDGLIAGLQKIVNLSPDKIADKLNKFFRKARFTDAKITDFYNILINELNPVDLQKLVLEEARRLGDLLPGEGNLQSANINRSL